MTTNSYTEEDLQVLAGKLREFGKSLTEPEQALLNHIVERATSLTDDQLDGVAGGSGNISPNLEPKVPGGHSLPGSGPAAKLRRF